MAETNVHRLLDKLAKGVVPDRSQIRVLLALSGQSQISRLFAAARQVRQQQFKNRIFLYGFLYFSTHCRNNCRFCQYRHGNTSLERYRKTLPDILTAAKEMEKAGVHLIDLTMGEDPQFYKTGFTPLVNLVRAVKRETRLPVMVSPGVLPDHVIDDLATAGADWLACYQETHNRTLYSDLRRDQNFDMRMDVKEKAANSGMLVEEGLLTGVGETLDDLTDSIIQMRDLPADQVRVMTFVPQPGTPMADRPSRSGLMELIIIAVMRLAMPDRLIPASLDVDGLHGLKDRLDAGANVVTSIVPPKIGLAGVAHGHLDIEESRRSTDSVTQVLTECGLTPASRATYRDWIRNRQNQKTTQKSNGEIIRSA